jgi:aminodeoxyfutalosine synthase
MSVDAISSIRPAVIEAARAGRRLEAADVRALAAVTDILAVGALADDARRARHGAATSFVRVHVLDLAMLATWTAPPAGAREVRLAGQPASPLAAVDAVQRAKAIADGLPLRGFVLADVVRLGGAPLLAELKSAGLDEIALVEPGADAAAAVQTARDAGLGVRVIGAIACPEDRAGWILEARALADAVGGFDAVAPLSDASDPTTPTTGFDDVRQVALARLALDTVPRVQVDWRRHGPKLAQVALTVGADDLDLVAADDDTSRGTRRAPLEEIRRNITAAGLTPAERDGRFASLAG